MRQQRLKQPIPGWQRTRIITIDRWSGWGEFKAWPQVNREFNELLQLLAVESVGGIEEPPLDLRDEGDRGA